MESVLLMMGKKGHKLKTKKNFFFSKLSNKTVKNTFSFSSIYNSGEKTKGHTIK